MQLLIIHAIILSPNIYGVPTQWWRYMIDLRNIVICIGLNRSYRSNNNNNIVTL